MTTTFYKCTQFRDKLLRTQAECHQYSKWSDEFVRKEINEVNMSMADVVLSDLSLEEKESLGFRKWSREDTLMLIPLWILPILDKNQTVVSISGDEVPLQRADNDNRADLMAYGVR